MLPVDQRIFDEWVGPAVDVKPIYNCKTLHESGGIAFELYKEAWRVVVFTAHLLDSTTAAQGGFARNQAICAGLMVKISKFMLAVIQLSTGDDRGEVVLALNRIIFEAAINLEFLVRSRDGKYFDQFVNLSLGPEREMYDQIRSNIEARGGEYKGAPQGTREGIAICNCLPNAVACSSWDMARSVHRALNVQRENRAVSA